MTNREKYLFDDFTFDNYRRMIKLAKERGFSFILHKDEYDPDRKEVIWRHDVEFEPVLALQMAKIENEEGARATYFFQLHSQFYNTIDHYYKDILWKIKDMGHHIGLHFDSAYWGITNENQLNEFIKVDREYLEKNIGFSIDTFSFHNTTAFTQSCLQYKYGGLINVYASFFKKHYEYCGDSLGYWRFDRLEDRLNDKGINHLHVLTHDGNWNNVVLSPRKRIKNVLYQHADRLMIEHVETLHGWGHLCPDDEED